MTRRLTIIARAPVALVTTCSLLGLLVATPATAAPSSATVPAVATDSADEIRRAAVQSFSQGDYPAAIEGFEAAHELSAEPTDLYNLGRIHEETGDLARALDHYERFVEQPHVALEERRVAAERIEVLRMLVEPETAEASTAINPSKPMVDDPRDANQPLVIAGSALLGVGVAAAAAGGIAFGVRGRRARDEVDGLTAGSNPGRLTLADAETLDARGRNADVLQTTFLVAGGVVAAVGISLLTVGMVRRSKKSRAPTINAALSPRYTAVSATWRF